MMKIANQFLMWQMKIANWFMLTKSTLNAAREHFYSFSTAERKSLSRAKNTRTNS